MSMRNEEIWNQSGAENKKHQTQIRVGPCKSLDAVFSQIVANCVFNDDY